MRRVVSVSCGVGVVAFSLACGGVSVPPRAHLMAVCGVVPIEGTGPLAEVDLPPRVATGTAWPVGTDALDAGPLALASQLGTEVFVLPAETAPAATVLEALRALEDRGQAVVVVDTPVPVSVPAPPDPAYAAELDARLSPRAPDMFSFQMAEEIAGLLSLCPPGGDVFAAVAHVDPAMRCELLAVGLEEALPNCPFTNGDKLITAVQMLVGPPPGAHQQSTITLRFAEDGVPLDLGTGTWGDVAAAVAALDGQAVALPAAAVPVEPVP